VRLPPLGKTFRKRRHLRCWFGRHEWRTQVWGVEWEPPTPGVDGGRRIEQLLGWAPYYRHCVWCDEGGFLPYPYHMLKNEAESEVRYRIRHEFIGDEAQPSRVAGESVIWEERRPEHGDQEAAGR